MEDYYKLVSKILDNGDVRGDRTGTGTKSLFGEKMVFDLREGFPLLTGKKTHFKSILHELLWFLSGDTNIKYLKENGVSIWNEWIDENGDLGPVYGKQWRSWTKFTEEEHRDIDGYVRTELVDDEVDQIQRLIEQLKNNPNSRRHIVSAWNVSELDEMALPPCHLLFQFYVSSDGHLDCQLYQRSADVFLGVPFNIASYSLLMYMVGEVVGLKPRYFHHTIGDAHIYDNHFDQAVELLDRYSKGVPNLPSISLNRSVDHIDDFEFEDFSLIGYKPLSLIKAPVAV